MSTQSPSTILLIVDAVVQQLGNDILSGKATLLPGHMCLFILEFKFDLNIFLTLLLPN